MHERFPRKFLQSASCGDGFWETNGKNNYRHYGVILEVAAGDEVSTESREFKGNLTFHVFGIPLHIHTKEPPRIYIWKVANLGKNDKSLCVRCCTCPYNCCMPSDCLRYIIGPETHDCSAL